MMMVDSWYKEEAERERKRERCAFFILFLTDQKVKAKLIGMFAKFIEIW